MKQTIPSPIKASDSWTHFESPSWESTAPHQLLLEHFLSSQPSNRTKKKTRVAVNFAHAEAERTAQRAEPVTEHSLRQRLYLLQTKVSQVEKTLENQAIKIESTIGSLQSSSRHLQRAVTRLAALASLESDWDGYGGLSPSAVAIATANSVLMHVFLDAQEHCYPFAPPYFIGPIANGGVQLVWKKNGHDAEVEVDRHGALFYLLDIDGEFIDSEELDSPVSDEKILGVLKSRGFLG